MGRRAIGVGVLYAGFLLLYAECSELRRKLTVKNLECEFYKVLLDATLDLAKEKEATETKTKPEKEKK